MSLWDRVKAAVGAFRADGSLISLSDPRILDIFDVPRSDSGEVVTPETAMRVAAVFACVQLRAGIIASLPVKIYERGKNGAAPNEVPDHDYWWYLNETPHPSWSAHSMWVQAMTNVLLRGDGFIGVLRKGATREKPLGVSNTVVGLKPLRWEEVNVYRALGSSSNLYPTFDPYEGERLFAADDMVHFTGMGFNGLRSQSVLSYAAFRATGIAIATDKYAGKFFANGAASRVVLENPKRMSQEQIDTLRNLWADRYTGIDNAHRPIVLTEGIVSKELTLTAQDSQLLESRKFQVNDIARAFGVPPFMIGETEGHSNWGTGVEQRTIAFVKYRVRDDVSMMEQSLNAKLFGNSKLFMRFDMEELLRGDTKAFGDFLRQAVGGSFGPGWMTRDEARLKQGLKPMGGDAAELYDPSTQGASDAGATETTGESGAAGDSGQADEGPDRPKPNGLNGTGHRGQSH